MIDLGTSVPPPISSPRPQPEVLRPVWRPEATPLPGHGPFPGQQLGDYRVDAPIGSGGMGDVFAGVHPVIGKRVAIKVLKPAIAAQPEFVARMLDEARVVSALRHRAIVDIFTFGTLPDGRPYLVMEYLEGAPLDAVLADQGRLPPDEAMRFLVQICAALAAVHAQGVVHRDLKPANVFLVPDGRPGGREVKLLDFGLAKRATTDRRTGQTLTGLAVGTPEYMAPEQARGGAVTPPTDLYALGVMAFEMLSGTLPFDGASDFDLMTAHVQTAPPRLSTRVDGLPPALDRLVDALLAKEPERRPQSADEVREALEQIQNAPSASDASPTPPMPGRLARWWRGMLDD